MKFVLHDQALNSDDETLSLIDRIVDRVADEIHRIELRDVDKFEASKWSGTTRPTRRRVLVTAASGPPRSSSGSLHSKVYDVGSPGEVVIANKLAHAPLTILVEDREADGVLLETVFEKLAAPEIRALWERLNKVTPRGVEIETSGGLGAMPQRLQRGVADAQNEGRPHRIFAICDGDDRWPGDPNNQSQASIERIKDYCGANAIPFHVLEKRNAENYIPDSVFIAARGLPENKSHVLRFDALLRRTVVQRDHFPIKDGLSDDERDQATAAGHYSAAEHGDLALLKERLFPKRPRLMLQIRARHMGDIASNDLRARDGGGELDQILNNVVLEF